MRTFFLFGLMAVGLVQFGTGQSNIIGDSLFTRKLLKEDINFLVERLAETHVRPATYATADEIDQALVDYRAKVDSGLTYYEFARATNLFLRTLQDSHSFVDYNSLMAHYSSSGGRFAAFTLKEIDGSFYISNDEFDQLPEGRELLSIDGVPINELMYSIMDFTVMEGESKIGALRIAEAVFPIILPTIHPLDTLIQVCLDEEAEVVCYDYKTRTRKEIKQNRKEKSGGIVYESRFKKKHGEVYDLTITDSIGFAMLKIASFSYSSPGRFERFLNRSFRKISKSNVKVLAIDLRDNTGGHSNRAELLLSYLSGSNATIPANIIARQSPLALERYRSNLKGLNKFMLGLNHRILRLFGINDEDYWNYKQMADLEIGEIDTVYYRNPPKINRFRFDGIPFLWVNGRSASASVALASSFRQQDLGKIIGEPTLGPITGTWGNPIKTSLPNTGLVVNLSTIRFNADNSFDVDPNPIEPDVEIDYQPEDLLNDNDPYLFKTLQFLRVINMVKGR